MNSKRSKNIVNCDIVWTFEVRNLKLAMTVTIVNDCIKRFFFLLEIRI